MSSLASLYDEKTVKASWGLPGYSGSEQDEGDYRNLLLSWSKLPAQTSRKEPVPRWFLCCDLLQVDREITLEQDTFLFARRIEVGDNGSLTLSRSDGNKLDLTLVGQQVVSAKTGEAASLPITLVGDNESVMERRFTPNADVLDPTGVLWSADSPEPAELDPRKIDAEYLREGEPLRLSLETLFNVAILLSTSDPDTSIAQLTWISALAGASPETSPLAARAASMAMSLLSAKAAGKNAILVPQLDLEIYARKSEAFLGLLQERQAQVDRYKDREFTADLWKGAAETMLATQQNSVDLNRKLESMADDTYRQAMQARTIAAKQLTLEEALVVMRKFEFDGDVKNWERRQKQQAAIDIVMGIVNILAQIPAVVVAGPEVMAMPLMQTAMQAGQFATDTVNSLINSTPPAPSAPSGPSGPTGPADPPPPEGPANAGRPAGSADPPPPPPV